MTVKASGTCANSRTISTPQLKTGVLGALKERLLQPELVEAFIAEYHRVQEEERLASASARDKVERARAKVTGKIGRLTDMMADGLRNNAEMKAVWPLLSARSDIDRRLEEAEVATAVAMHPGIAAACRRNVEKLMQTLNAPELEASEARQAPRNLVELITAEPREEGCGLDLLVNGRLAQILHSKRPP